MTGIRSAREPAAPAEPVGAVFLALALLGVGLFNSLQYLALVTSTPINVTLVASSMPVWMDCQVRPPSTDSKISGQALRASIWQRSATTMRPSGSSTGLA